MTNTMGEERAQCRLPDRLNELLEEAAEERGVFRSEVTRRALRYYVGVNPDGIEVLRGVSATGIRDIDRTNKVGSETEPEPIGETVSGTDTDEYESDTEPMVAEVVDDDLDGEREAATDGGVYDPTEDM